MMKHIMKVKLLYRIEKDHVENKCAIHVSDASNYWTHTSIISGCTNWLSVTRVTTVSVSVLFVMVSVTLPSVVGAGGKLTSPGKLSGCFIVTVTMGP